METVQLDTMDRIDAGPADAVEHADLKALFKLWNERRGEAHWPGVHALSPRDMKDYLRRVHVYDVIDGGRDFRMRVIGTAIATLRGTDLTGTLLSSHPDLKLRDRIIRICRMVVDGGKPIRVTVAHPVMADKDHVMKVEALWMPLGGAAVERVLAQSVHELLPF